MKVFARTKTDNPAVAQSGPMTVKQFKVAKDAGKVLPMPGLRGKR